MMNKFLKKLFGIDKIEEQVSIETQRKLVEIEEQISSASKLKMEAESEALAAMQSAVVAKEQERLARLSPKELATEKKEPWVGVLETHVNKENIRNGFFDLDWNEYFVLELRSSGYKGSSDEEIVDQWFSDLCRNVAVETGIDMSQRGSGYINKALRDDGKSEIF
jgi:hypothetical protein